MRFIFFTKTRWCEPPRLRHQLARLLAGAGHEVIFFERPRHPWRRARLAETVEAGICVCSHEELLHHKLRIARPLRAANACYTMRSIRAATQPLALGEADVVVNFNYDYWFLRKLYPRNRLITVINDDHISHGLLGYVKPLAEVQRLTCGASDVVLTVSKPLQRQIRGYCEPRLFLPWSNERYTPPCPASARDTLLFWGYINRKIDFPFVVRLADELATAGAAVRMLFVGPLESHETEVRRLRSHPSIEVRDAAELKQLPLERVLAAIIPYRAGDPEIDVITYPNKAAQLLAHGLPLIVKGMPEFIEAPFVFRFDDANGLDTVRNVRQRFAELQPIIEQFVESNRPQARLEQFLSFVQ